MNAPRQRCPTFRGLLGGALALALGMAASGCRVARSSADAPRPGLRPGSVTLQTLEGRTGSAPVPPGTRAVVFVFLGIECPIANRALPELVALEAELGARGVRFVHVYPNADETPDLIRKHRVEFGLAGPAFRDPDLEAARALGARWTPEAVALTPDGALLYRGRINDQYAALGVGRPEPTRHDLAEALREFLAGGLPSGRVVPGVGCTFRGPS